MNKSEKIKMKIDKNRRAGKPVEILQKELIKEVEKQVTQVSFFLKTPKFKAFRIILTKQGLTGQEVLSNFVDQIIENHKS